MRALVALCCVLAAPAFADQAALARAEKIVAGGCFLCHGMQGEMASELFSRLAAQNAAYIAKQLANFKSGERGHGSEQLPRLAGQVASYLAAQIKNFGARERTDDNAMMHSIAAQMTEPEIRAVAEYLGGLD